MTSAGGFELRGLRWQLRISHTFRPDGRHWRSSARWPRLSYRAPYPIVNVTRLITDAGRCAPLPAGTGTLPSADRAQHADRYGISAESRCDDSWSWGRTGCYWRTERRAGRQFASAPTPGGRQAPFRRRETGSSVHVASRWTGRRCSRTPAPRWAADLRAGGSGAGLRGGGDAANRREATVEEPS